MSKIEKWMIFLKLASQSLFIFSWLISMCEGSLGLDGTLIGNHQKSQSCRFCTVTKEMTQKCSRGHWKSGTFEGDVIFISLTFTPFVLGGTHTKKPLK